MVMSAEDGAGGGRERRKHKHNRDVEVRGPSKQAFYASQAALPATKPLWNTKGSCAKSRTLSRQVHGPAGSLPACVHRGAHNAACSEWHGRRNLSLRKTCWLLLTFPSEDAFPRNLFPQPENH